MADTSVRRTLRLNQETMVCCGLFLLDAVLLCLAAVRHTFWRDESQAWLIARDSPSLAALFHNLHYETHPPLWHLLLYAITRFSWNPEWMKLPNLFFAIVAAGLVLFCQRLSLTTRTGIVFSYYFLFEYGVIDRNYMLGVVLLVAATLLATGGGRAKSWAVPVMLSLAIMSSLPALILALGVWGVYLAHEAVGQGSNGQPAYRRHLRSDLLLGSTLVTICALGSALFIRPATGTGAYIGNAPYPTGTIGMLANSGKYVVKAFMPIPRLSRQFWESSYYDILPHHLGVLVDLLGWSLLLGLGMYFRQLSTRLFFLICSGILLLQCVLSDHASMRHVGWLFLCLALALLMEYADQGAHDAGEDSRPPWHSWMLRSILVCQIVGGIFALAVSLRCPFSSSRQVAEFLRSRNLDSAPLVFEPDYVGSSVLAYLQRPTAYDLEQHRLASFVVFNREERLNMHVPNRADLDEAYGGKGAPVLILGKRLTLEQEDGLKVHLLAAYDNAINPFDAYYIYR
jgi:hypothetical protein